jgi:hypothetical protein
MKKTSIFLLFSCAVWAQTLGQFRIVDFAARTPATIGRVQGNAITTTQPHGLKTGDAVYIYQPLTVAQDAAVPSFGNHGNRGRGYFIVSVSSDTSFALASEMYTGATVGIGNGVAGGDRIVPLTIYYLRQGPRGWLDGPIDRGAWNSSTAYKPLEMVSATDGNSYESIADNTNQQPPNAAYWKQIDPKQAGPGTFTASLRDPAGKAGAGNFPFSYGQTLLAKNWQQPDNSFDFSNIQSTGGWGSASAWVWFARDDPAWYGAALRLATQTEDLANGTTACDETQAYCGGRTDIDYARLAAQAWLGALSTVYDTLTPAQKQGFADRMLNDNDVTHNGVETNGGCTKAGYLPADGSLTLNASTVTGSGTAFTSLSGLAPGSVLLEKQNVSHYVVIGRVKSVDSDTQITLEGMSPRFWGANFPVASWVYAVPFGYNGAHTCGVIWLLKHHASSPRLIPGEERAYGSDYPVNLIMDDSPRQNKAIVALSPYISAAMLLGNDDIRAVRLGEQAINYYMTQTMAQENKSRWTGFDGHGTQYGTDRTASAAANIALVLKNSLTVTPPGILSGGYLKNIPAAYQYAFWLGRPQFVQAWATGYGVATGSYLSERLTDIGIPMLLTSALYPDDPFAAVSMDYLRRRRGDFGDIKPDGGWGALGFLQYAIPFYDPQAPAQSPDSLPLQRAFSQTDAEECIAAGLYCRPDTGESIALSQTGWNGNDTQVMIQAQSALPTWDDDNYGTAGSYTILQNSGLASAYLLGGNGLATSGLYPSSGMEHGNTISFFNAATKKDMWAKSGSGMQYAALARWAGDPVTGVTDNSYSYAMIDLAPKVRASAQGYDSGAAVQGCVYQAAVCAGGARIQRHIIHFKKPADSNYIVSYDDIAIASAAFQPRAYFHYEISDSILPGADKRHPDWITTYDPAAKAVVLTVPGTARLSSRFLDIGGFPAHPPVSRRLGSATWPQDLAAGSRVALVREQDDGTYTPTTGLVAAAVPGSYRVAVCASNDGLTCTESNHAEWIAVHKPSTNPYDLMPQITQPSCKGFGGDCAAVEIDDTGAPKVAVFARRGQLLSSVTLVTNHPGTAQYVVAGLAPGTYSVTLGTRPVLTGVTVAANDNTLSFQSASGLIGVVAGDQTGSGRVPQ